MKTLPFSATAALAAVLASTTPSSGQTVIYACVNTSNGQIRVVALPSQCRGNETAVSWDVVGSKGAPGGLTAGRTPAQATPQGSSGFRTHLLFPFVSNAGGFDTTLSISNTTADPFGTAPVNGPCRIHYYGFVGGGVATIAPQQTPAISAGTTYSFSLSEGGVAGYGTAGLRGYVIADCAFPMAHGFFLVTDIGAQRLAAGGLAIVLPNTRNPAVVESQGK